MKFKHGLKYFTTKEAALKWEVTPRTVAKYCRKGLLPKAFKKSGVWQIPENSIKPLKTKTINNTIIIIIKLLNEINLEEGNLSNDIEKYLPKLKPAFIYLEQQGYIYQAKDKGEDISIRNISITEKGYQGISTKIEINIKASTIIEMMASIIKVISILRS